MLGYYEDDAATQEVVTEDGWMKTGDLATFNEQGYCSIVGRSKDTIIRGGENIAPREVDTVDTLVKREGVIYRLPSVYLCHVSHKL